MDFDASAGVVGTLVVVGMGVLAVAGVDALRRRARIRRRMEPLADLLDAGDAPLVAPVREQAVETTPLIALFDRRFPLAGGTRTLLIAGASATLAFAGLVPALMFVGVPVVVAGLAGLLLACLLAFSIADYLEQRQRALFCDRLLIVVEDFQRMVRFGMTGMQAFQSVAANAEEPVKASLQRVAVDADFGMALGTAVGREARRVRISELAMLAAIMTTQSRTGGGMSESVGNLATMLRGRTDNRTRVRAATSESKISLIVLTGVPFAMVGIQAILQPELVDTLLGQARHLLGIGVGLISVGLAVAWFLVRGAGR